jgi:hypothetical protein
LLLSIAEVYCQPNNASVLRRSQYSNAKKVFLQTYGMEVRELKPYQS